MDAADVFRQGLGSVIPRPPQYFYNPPGPPRTSQPPQSAPSLRRPPTQQRDDESDVNSHRIAHTLTACCRCRQASTFLFLARGSMLCPCYQTLLHARGRWLRGSLAPKTCWSRTDSLVFGLLPLELETFESDDEADKISRYSAKRGATQRSPDVCLANDPAQSANTSIPRGTRR